MNTFQVVILLYKMSHGSLGPVLTRCVVSPISPCHVACFAVGRNFVQNMSGFIRTNSSFTGQTGSLHRSLPEEETDTLTVTNQSFSCFDIGSRVIPTTSHNSLQLHCLSGIHFCAVLGQEQAWGENQKRTR